jgi:1-acyl-sn-glycerol-3-phosphate acyltransferase
MSSPLLYPVIGAGARVALSALATVRREGLSDFPDSGGVLLLPNHQSALDPFLVQAWAPRRVRSMTKSTQFASGFMRWVVPRLGGFPVRRYRIDPQSVRMVLRLLDEGEVVCIYPEGERTWDGTLQPFRRGTLRVALSALARGHAVLPVGIEGMYDVLPRWGRPRRHPGEVFVRYGSPMAPPGPLTSRRERDKLLPNFEAELRTRLLELSGEAHRPLESWPGSALSAEPPEPVGPHPRG